MHKVMKRNSRMMPRSFPGIWDNELFTGFFGEEAPVVPAVNVVEKDNEFAVDISVPGFDKNDISIEVDNNTLKISANHENKNEEKDSNDKVIRREFSSSSFERSFVLPENIDTENINAKQENGVLKISLPKMNNAPEDKIKKITVA